jgi:adenylate cyclase
MGECPLHIWRPPRPTVTFRPPHIVLGLVIGVVGTFAALMPFVAELEQSLGLSWLFHLRGPRPAPDEVVIVAIDHESAQRLHLQLRPNAWPRGMHGRLVKALTRAGAKAVVFDLTFESPSPQPAQDRALAEAIRQAGNVVLVAALRAQLYAEPSAATGVGAAYMVESVVAPVQPLADAALAYAPFVLPKTDRIDAYWTFKSNGGENPCMPIVAFQVYAVDAFDDILARLRSVPTVGEPAVSPDGKTMLRTRKVVADMRGLRQYFAAFRGAAQRLQEELRNDSAADPRIAKLALSLSELYAEGESRLLDFYGPPRSIRTIPYHRIVEEPQGNGDSALTTELAGKVVFVGFSGATAIEQDQVRDDYRTVFSRPDGLNLSGIEIAATAFANLAEDRPVRPLEPTLALAFILAWGVALGMLFRNLPIVAIVPLAVVATLGYLGFAVQRFGATSIWWPLVTPLCLQMPAALLGALGFRYARARRDRDALRRMFGQFVPAPVVDRLAKTMGPITAENEVVYGVCLSTDAKSYTTLSEQMAPGPLGELMNDYFGHLFAPVARHEGVVLDVVGDAMLAVWAGASSSDVLRRQACHAALDIAATVEEFNRSPDHPPVPTRIGLHAGRILLGHIGAGQHYEYRAVGDIVNTATRIESLGKQLGSNLLLSAEVLEGLDEFLYRPLGDFVLVGKKSPVAVAELLVRREEATPEQSWLCGQFAAALVLFRQRRWDEAQALLAAILEQMPKDGPALFYVGQCARLAASPPDEDWNGTIFMTSK